MEGGLWGIIVKEDEDEALVTLPSEKYIQVVQLVVSTNAVVKFINAPLNFIVTLNLLFNTSLHLTRR